jgi:hypothetical protein
LASQTSSVVAEKATGPEVVSSASEISITSLAKEIHDLIDGDRYFLSPRARTLQEILHMIRPQPVRESAPPLRNYEPPEIGRYRRRR